MSRTGILDGETNPIATVLLIPLVPGVRHGRIVESDADAREGKVLTIIITETNGNSVGSARPPDWASG